MNKSSLPTHVSMIMDGNGRWAKARNLPRTEGHREGLESVRAVVEYAAEQGIPYLSLFAFSSENWNRPKQEIEILFGLMLKAIEEEVPTFVKNGIRMSFIGNAEMLSANLLESIRWAEQATSGGTRLHVLVALSYSGKWDITHAARLYAADVAAGKAGTDVSEEEFAQYLSTAAFPNPDLLIRTSGEERISNFFLWQLAYTELYFTPILWPDFRKLEFQIALDAFANRKRRFGKTDEQLTNKPLE